MKQRPFKFRMWDPILKQMGAVNSLELTADGGIRWARGSLSSKGPQDIADGFQGAHLTIMQSTGVQDDNKTEIFEEDLLDCIFLHPKSNYMTPMRARVIWNPYIHMGPVGFVLMDQDGGMHPFSTMDSFVVIGNTFQGVTKTT